jgi:hypothetical protein
VAALMTELIASAVGRRVRRVEVTANQHALAFYKEGGFVADHEVDTRFGPAPRMRLDLEP